MPQISIKHVLSFSSEDKIHKAENVLKHETYRKWKCATPGEKKAVVEVQFEKATKINSIDIGNECSAFVEVLVGRASDANSDYQVLLVASSFMSPMESRNETHTNRVRMFGPEKLTQNIKDEKWDTAQIVCTQPFNKNITYGLSFIKFHSPPEVVKESNAEPEQKKEGFKLGSFKLKSDNEEEDDSPSVGMWFNKRNTPELTSPASMKDASSFAAAVLAENSRTALKNSPQMAPNIKRKAVFSEEESLEPPAKKESLFPKRESPLTKRESPLASVTREKVLFSMSKESASPVVVQSPKTPVTIKPKPVVNLQPKTLDKLKEFKNTTEKRPEKRNEKPFHKIMGKVVFVLSGFVNPMRSELRDKAVEMGAKYKGDWDSTCTHLICAFLNTPKYNQVLKSHGKIVRKDWIIDCYRRKQLLPWKTYMLGKYSYKSSSDETDSDLEIISVKPSPKSTASSFKFQSKNESPKVNGSRNVNGNLKPKAILFQNENKSIGINKDDSETEDEEALNDYMAKTDVESDSGGDTEDEIRKIEEQNAKASVNRSPAKKASPSKPNTANLPLPELPDFFKNKHFFLFGDFSEKTYHDLQRYVVAYNGVVEDYMSDTVKYVISESNWDENFDDALSENEDLIFVRPQWIFKCNEVGKFVPYQPFIISNS